eukprot:GHVU01218860.1.p1 GENE.GHVU01218860.1~~GHVU01218860.1.p1  ORF type:complete len:108 (+),score=1.09 GHVU01218860.1:278-601(+)
MRLIGGGDRSSAVAGFPSIAFNLNKLFTHIYSFTNLFIIQSLAVVGLPSETEAMSEACGASVGSCACLRVCPRKGCGGVQLCLIAWDCTGYCLPACLSACLRAYRCD